MGGRRSGCHDDVIGTGLFGISNVAVWEQCCEKKTWRNVSEIEILFIPNRRDNIVVFADMDQGGLK